MRLVTFSTHGTAPRLGVSVEDRIIDLRDAVPSGTPVPDTMLQLITDGPEAVTALTRAVSGIDLDSVSALGTDEIRYHTPYRPGKFIGVGLNYSEHVAESSRSLDTDKQRPDRPVLFSKPSTAVVGHQAAIQHNGDLTEQLDWEVELAVIIGRTAKGVSKIDAMSHVFGYSIVNDISARDQRRSGQWFYSKGQDTYAPFGPVLVTSDDIDPHGLELALYVNEEKMQWGNTSQMIFTIEEIIADVSAGMTLEPGDVIMTGSPEGVGAAKNPPRFLKPGDVVRASIESIGELVNPVEDAR